MFLDFFKLSIKSLKHRKLRSWLTILGIIIGVSLIVSLLFLGEGLKIAVVKQLRMFGTDLIFIFPGEETNPLLGMLGGLELRNKDVEAIRDVPGVRAVLPMNTKIIRAEFRGEEKSITLHGSPWAQTKLIYEESQGYGLERGAWPEKDSAMEVILGWAVSRQRFREPIRVGDEIILRGRKMKVAGIYKATGEQTQDSMIFTSMENFRKLTGKTAGVESAVVKVQSGYTVDQVAEDVRHHLAKQRGAEEFVVLTTAKAALIVGDILAVIEIILAGVAAVALLVGGVGIMNTMFTAILERTREIGVMKAVGAAHSKIMLLFLIESGLVGLIGGFIGLVLGIGFTKLTEFVAFRQGFEFLKVSLNPVIIVSVLILTFLFGSAAGLLPSHRAARLNPAEALRKR